MMEKFYIFLIISIYSINAADDTQVDIDNPKSCPYDRIFEPEKSICCENLNKKRTEFATCCKYPILVIYRDDYESCVEYCTDPNTNSPADRCCVMPCCFKKLGILTDFNMDISTDGLIKSFMMSIGNKEEWKEPITDVVESCTTAIKEPPNPDDQSNYWDCFQKIPYYLYDIVDCAYDYNFLKCPNFPFEQDSCYESYYYVYDCFLNGTNLLSSPLLDPRKYNSGGDYSDGSFNNSSSSEPENPSTDPPFNSTLDQNINSKNESGTASDKFYNDY